jgi:hypothetical protein
VVGGELAEGEQRSFACDRFRVGHPLELEALVL